MESPIVKEDIWQGSDRLYILFGGVFGRLGTSYIEFAQSAGILDYSRIFLRDPNRAWYQNGLPEVGDSLQDIAHFLDKKIKETGAKDVRFVGNCMGGFAAILFCALIGRGRAITFAPQTFLSPERSSHFGDERAPQLLKDLWSAPAENHIYDLRPWLLTNAPEVSVDIYVSTGDKYDLIHADELKGLRNIKINYYEEGGHGLINYLSSTGTLRSILAA